MISPAADEIFLSYFQLQVGSDLFDANREATMREVKERDATESPHRVCARLSAEFAQNAVENARFAGSTQKLFIHAAGHQLAVVNNYN